MTRFPVLLGQDMAENIVIQPVTYRLRESLTPLSTASITVLDTVADRIPLRSFIRLYSPNGDAGVYRVISRSTSAGMSAELTLQHGLCTLSDHMHPRQSEETSSCRALLEKLLSNQRMWALGTVDVPDDEPMTWKCSGTNDLKGLTDIMKELPGYCLDFDQTALPWVLHVRKKPEDVRCEARMSRNLIDAQIVVDTSDMCNVAYADGLDEPVVADTVDKWGRIERKVSADSDMPAEILDKTVRRYLDTHKNPRITITLKAVELSRMTGEPLDCFLLGTLCRCIIDGMETVQRIEVIDWSDPIGTPQDVSLTLASTQKDMSVTIAGLVVDTSVRFEQHKRLLVIDAQKIAMLSEQMLIKADNLRIDAIETEIKGLVTMSEFQASVARIGALEADAITASTLSGALASLDAINLSGGLSANSVQAQYGDFTNATIGHAACKKSTLTIGDKTCVFFAPSDATFELSDMPGYDAAMDAARTEGAASVYAVSMEVYDGAYDMTSRCIRATADVTLSSGMTSAIGITVDASSAYDAGYEAGWEAAKAAISVEGEITAITNPAQGYYMATGWAGAKLDGVTVKETTFSKTQRFGS